MSPTMIRFTPLAVSLCLVTIGLYLPVWNHGFVEFDDPLYVTANTNVSLGLTMQNVRWAFWSSDAFIWHPLTWLSYLLDASLYGTNQAGPWHLTNVALHAMNVFLLFATLNELTKRNVINGRMWACAFATALFAFHPIQTESVAWVSSRKELLAGTFLLLTILAYARYARRPDAKRYAWVVAMMILGVTAKGSHVGLPFLLLLLDYWPLGRLTAGTSVWLRLRGLVVEKLPLLAVSLASIAVNFSFVSRSENLWVTDPTLLSRCGAASVNLLSYLARLIWPTKLAIVYPNSLQAPVGPAPAYEILAAILLLGGVSVLVARAGRRRAYWIVGWLWFLAMLGPMLGLIPMGLRTPHDRYAYVPMMGLAIAAAFGLVSMAQHGRARRTVAALVAVALLLAFGFTTRRQIGVWKDSTTLFDHSLRVTERNAIVHNAQGITLASQGKERAAIREFEAALEIHPRFAGSNNNIGYTLVQAGKLEPGIVHLKRALEVRPDWTRARLNLGRAQLGQGAFDDAVATFQRAVAGEPDTATVRSALGVALMRAQRRAEAIEAFRAALRIDPDDPTASRLLKREAE